MPSYYIDTERCFEVPFLVPLPDKEIMAIRLANIRLILKQARERQSLSNAEHRRKHSTRPIKYRDKAKAIMERGRLKRFVGNLTERYLDYLDFHQESLNELSPLIIPVPPLCSPLSAPSPCLFGPPRQGDYNEVIGSNLSWSQFAAPVPAGWRERFIQERLWDCHIEHRAFDEFSDEEREAEHIALDFQRRQLGIFLQMTSNTPPPLQRKRFVPLPLASPTPLLLGALPSGESGSLKCDSRATYNLPSRNIADLISSPSRIPSRIEIDKMTTPPRRQQPPSEHTTQKPSHSYQLSRRRPSLHVTIPDTECLRPWLDGHLCDSPLSGIGVDTPYPSVLLNADAVRAHLDGVHGPHVVSPQPKPPQAYTQSPPQCLIPSKRVVTISAGRMSAEEMRRHDIREPSFAVFSGPQSSISVPHSSAPKPHTDQPRPLHSLKRRASQGCVVASNSLKKPRLVASIPLMIFS